MIIEGLCRVVVGEELGCCLYHPVEQFIAADFEVITVGLSQSFLDREQNGLRRCFDLS